MNEQHVGSTIRLELAGGPLDGADIEVPVPAPRTLRVVSPDEPTVVGDYGLIHATTHDGRSIWWYQDPALRI